MTSFQYRGASQLRLFKGQIVPEIDDRDYGNDEVSDLVLETDHIFSIELPREFNLKKWRFAGYIQ